MADEQIVWRRPDGCTCGAKLDEDKKTGTLVAARVVEKACPFHGDAAARIDAAVGAALRIIRTTPGLPAVDEATLRRVMVAIYPVITGMIAPTPDDSGNVPEPTVAGPAQ